MEQSFCTNGRKPAQVSSTDGCCQQYVCECVCSVWSKSNYVTFDGKSFTFNESCSYYLVKEITDKYNLTITVNKHDCDPSDGTFCPQSLTIIYQSNTVLLTQQNISGSAVNVVYVNQKRIYPAFSNSVLRITGTKSVITLEIPAIQTEVVYRGSSFSINIPYSLFGGNTEGQCGTCDNSQTNDCRSPNGQVANCSSSAGQWHVSGSTCAGSTTTTTTTPTTTTTGATPTTTTTGTTPTTTTAATTVTKPITTTATTTVTTTAATPTTTAGATTGATPSSATTAPQSTISSTVCSPTLCNLLTSSVFSACHSVISPGTYVTSCQSNSCSNNSTCSVLEAYATACSSAGVCIDWRNATGGLCEHTCPTGKVYKACGPKVEPTCNGRYNQKFQSSGNSTTEGCFCPQGTTLFNAVYDVCVAVCGCVGPDGKPKQPGDSWTSGCNTCVCDKDSMSVHCEPIQCPTPSQVNCSGPGQQLVNTTGSCCTTQSCECNVKLCPAAASCSLGFQLNVSSSSSNSSCCPTSSCVPKGVCVYNGIEYKPGDKVPTTATTTTTTTTTMMTAEPPLQAPMTTAPPSGAGRTSGASGSEQTQLPGPCKECTCSSSVNPVTHLNVITCTPIVCNTNCSQGYEYQAVSGQCCGTCVQTSCVITTSNQTTQVVHVNGTYVSSSDRCVQYTCVSVDGKVQTQQIKTTCPPFNPLDCEPGTETTDANGCCQSCTLRSVCTVQNQPTVISSGGCQSAQPVNLTYCAGHCGSSSIYSAATNAMMHQCECCQEASSSQRQVELTCSDGSTVQHSYTVADTCSCAPAQCATTTATATSGRAQRRRRR
ncbi:uncharacterized protein V6R79_009622 [Siganus canaliculatus]